MGHHQEGGLRGAAQLTHQVLNALGSVLIKVAGRFIEQHQARTIGQGTGNGHALTLATGQLCRLVRQPMTETHTLQQRRSALTRLGNGHPTNQQRHADVFQGAELGEQMVELIDEAQRPVAQQTALFFIQGRQLFARQPDTASARRIQTAEHVEQGALARTGAADNRHALAGQQFQLQVGQYHHRLRALVITLAQVTATEHGTPGLGFIGHSELTHSARPLRAGCGRHARRDIRWQKNSATRRRR